MWMSAPRTGLAAVLGLEEGVYSSHTAVLLLRCEAVTQVENYRPLGTSHLKQEAGEAGRETNVLESPHQTQLGLAGCGSYCTCSSSAVTSRNPATGTSLLVQVAAGDPSKLVACSRNVCIRAQKPLDLGNFTPSTENPN